MLAGIRSRLTYANVVASIALFVALGGVAWAAATINSKDVVDNSLKSVDLKDGKGVKGVDVAQNSLTGADINFGSHLVTSASQGIGNYALATCPAGEIATGGGGMINTDFGNPGALRGSSPYPNAGRPTGWSVIYESSVAAGGVIAIAVCMPG